MAEAAEIQDLVAAFVRAFGLHHPDRTPCGQPVSVSEAHALMELGQAGPLQQRNLVARLQLDKSTVSRLVGKLRRRGWLGRGGDPRDGRAVRLLLTEAGCQAAQQMALTRRAKFSQLMDALGPQDHQAVVRGLTVLVQSLNKIEGKLRNVHLQAHLQMVDALTESQVARYDELRGYLSNHEGQPSITGHDMHGAQH